MRSHGAKTLAIRCRDAGHSVQNKRCRLLARNCSDRASESLGQKNGPRRDMRMTGFIVTGFRCGPSLHNEPACEKQEMFCREVLQGVGADGVGVNSQFLQ